MTHIEITEEQKTARMENWLATVRSPEAAAARKELCAMIEERLFGPGEWRPVGETHGAIVRRLNELGLWETTFGEFDSEGGIVRESMLGGAVNVVLATAFLGLMQTRLDAPQALHNSELISCEEMEAIEKAWLRAENDGQETVLRPFVQRVWRENPDCLNPFRSFT
jgi:hypothetical protein